MKNMNNKQKVLIFKISIILCGIFTIITGIIGTISDKYQQGTSWYNTYFILGMTSISIAAIFATIAFSLMGKVKIDPERTTPKKVKLKNSGYEEFEKMFLKQVYNTHYDEAKVIPNDLNCDIKYLIKKKLTINNVVLIVKQAELSEKTMNSYFEYCLNHIIEKEPYLSKKSTNLIHIICVDKTNENFKQFTEHNVEQGYGRFNLPIGISFDSKTVYIATQKGGLFIARYKKLVKMFKEYIKNQIVNDKWQI